MNIHVFVVSHGHGALLSQLAVLPLLNNKENISVYIKNNCHDDELMRFAQLHNINIINDKFGLGFGANNNYLYEQLKVNNKIQKGDYIVILNPDVKISSDVIRGLADRMESEQVSIASINLFKNDEMTIYDNSIRKWPTLKNFIYSFLGKKNETIIDKTSIDSPLKVNWAAGSFIAIRAELYEKLGGFDEGYFMYCEDIDLCYRAALLQESMIYYPEFKAVHYAAHANRTMLSKHFFWHVKSVIRFLIKKNM